MARYLLHVRRNPILYGQRNGSLSAGTDVVSMNWFFIVGRGLLQRVG